MPPANPSEKFLTKPIRNKTMPRKASQLGGAQQTFKMLSHCSALAEFWRASFFFSAVLEGWLLGGLSLGTKGVLALGTAQRNIAAALVVGEESFDESSLPLSACIF